MKNKYLTLSVKAGAVFPQHRPFVISRPAVSAAEQKNSLHEPRFEQSIGGHAAYAPAGPCLPQVGKNLYTGQTIKRAATEVTALLFSRYK